MIAVLADDFTGGAESAGIGLRYGLKTELQTELNPAAQLELIVLDTDSRALIPSDAAEKIRTTLKALESASPEWIYKKADSVLRGPVLTELEAAMEASGKDRTLLVPANPSLGRRIRNGRYFIDGKPLEQTGFADDPEHPASSSDVIELLGPAQSVHVCARRYDQALPKQAIVVGDAECYEDLKAWATKLEERTLPAGGAEFFSAILEARGFTQKPRTATVKPPEYEPALFICTSGSQASRRMVEQARAQGVPVCEMPSELVAGEPDTQEHIDRWTDETLRCLGRAHRVIVSIGRLNGSGPATARTLREYMARFVEAVLKKAEIRELYIEGGATASAVVRRPGWKRFIPRDEFAPGVVRLEVLQRAGQHVTAKPGSYEWPRELWKQRR
jgi:uncharacterized protein YgbK (DUF1537 family)